MARPENRFTTTRSVVEARAMGNGPPVTANHRPVRIKAIPRRKALAKQVPFLSCRGAVIVDTDNKRVGGQWVQPKAVHVGVRLRVPPCFQCPEGLSWFSPLALPR